MGQYFMPTILGEKYNIEATLYSFDYGQRLKLMEHSYIGNPLVCAVAMLITTEPKRVAWIGDYAQFGDIRRDKTITEDQFTKIQKNRWKNEAKGIAAVPGNMETGYLVNYTKMQFIDLAEYCRRVRAWDYKINPLPLLTAVGNGRGGGDYGKNGSERSSIGAWAFDVIQFWPTTTKETLKGFSELKIMFIDGPPDRP